MKGLRTLLLAVISLFFLFAGISKIPDPAAFSIAIEQYQLVGGTLSWISALWLPWLECLAGLCIWLRGWRLASVVVLSGMLVAFQIALLSTMIRGLDISCGCFGSGTDSSAMLSFIRNFFLLAGLLFLARRTPAES